MLENNDKLSESEKNQSSQPENLPANASSEEKEIKILRNELLREKEKNTSLFYIIGGALAFEAGRTLQFLHEIVALIGSIMAVILSVYGLFKYFEAYTHKKKNLEK